MFSLLKEEHSESHASSSGAPSVYASRSVSLFELQEAEAEQYTTFHSLHGMRPGCPSVTSWWPSVGPGDMLPAPGCVWVVLFDPASLKAVESEKVGDGDAHGKPPQHTAPEIVAFIEARVCYRESLVKILHATHERKESDEPPKEVSHEYMLDCIDRLSAVADDLSALADQANALLEWRNPRLSLLSWGYLMFLCVAIDDGHIYAIPCIVLATAVALALRPRVTGSYQMGFTGVTLQSQTVYVAVKTPPPADGL